MAEIGIPLDADSLVLTRGRDFKWSFQNLDTTGTPVAFPAGDLFFEFSNALIDNWEFVITGDTAALDVESEVVDTVPARTKWQLVFLPDGETAGGEAIALGQVQVQGV